LKVVENALELVGDTPMIKLSFPGEDTVIYAKVEYLNPSGSVKDRIARHLIAEAEKRGTSSRATRSSRRPAATLASPSAAPPRRRATR